MRSQVRYIHPHPAALPSPCKGEGINKVFKRSAELRAVINAVINAVVVAVKCNINPPAQVGPRRFEPNLDFLSFVHTCATTEGSGVCTKEKNSNLAKDLGKAKKMPAKLAGNFFALRVSGLGFEPRMSGPKPLVIPFHHPE
ncbi:hypothetical protein Dip510_002156 [Elusimicrobium posterum]